MPSYPTAFRYPLKFHIATVPHDNVIYACPSVRLCVFVCLLFFYARVGVRLPGDVLRVGAMSFMFCFVEWKGGGGAVSLNLKRSFPMVMRFTSS